MASASIGYVTGANDFFHLRPSEAERWGIPDAFEGWRSPLTKLGAELEGHSLGGGMLKLEPSEAARVPVPMQALKLTAGDESKLDQAIREARAWRHHE